MSRLKRALMALAALFLGGLFLMAAVLFALNHSTVDSTFACSGKSSRAGGSRPAEGTMTLREFKAWVRLFSKSAGRLDFDTCPPTATCGDEPFGRFDQLVRLGEQLQIFDSQGRPAGSFSARTGTLVLSAPGETFEGVCKRH